jgi:hypothetical protein
MKLATRSSLLFLFAAMAGLLVATIGAPPADAAVPFSVSVSPNADVVPLGSSAVFRVKVEGKTTSLPSFDYDVEGGTLAGVASLDPTAANVAEGAVFVTRDSEGSVRLSIRFGAETLAAATARFAPMGTIAIAVTLDAGPEAAARTWRYEVANASGQIVASLSANTSGDSPVSVVHTPPVPYGFYSVRQILGSDTARACASGVFYEVATPVSGATTVELAELEKTVSFTIRPCPDLPKDLGVLIPVDTISPPLAPVLAPGEAPVSEVRGARDAGPGNPLPPSVGNSIEGRPSDSSSLLIILFASALVLTSLSGGVLLAVRRQ